MLHSFFIVVPNLSVLRMYNTLTICVHALEGKPIFLGCKSYFDKFLTIIYLLNGFLTVVLEETITNKCLFYSLVVLGVEFTDGHRHVAVLGFSTSWITAVQLNIHCADFCLHIPQFVLFLFNMNSQIENLVLDCSYFLSTFTLLLLELFKYLGCFHLLVLYHQSLLLLNIDELVGIMIVL